MGAHLFFLGGEGHHSRPAFVPALKVGGGQQPRELLAPNFQARNASMIGLALRAWRARMDGLQALMLASGIFGFFHVIFGHPFPWLILCCAQTAQIWLRTLKPARRASIALRYSPAVFQQQ